MAGQMHSLLRRALSLFLVLALSGCGSSELNQRTGTSADGQSKATDGSDAVVFKRGLPNGDLQITRGNQPLLELQVEIAETPEAMATGLMNVKNLPPEAGMAFLMGSPTRGSFHMKNTLIPLDIAFWNENSAIVDILQMTPCEKDPCRIYTPSRQYIGALEVNRGLLDSKGIRLGDRVRLTRT